MNGVCIHSLTSLDYTFPRSSARFFLSLFQIPLFPVLHQFLSQSITFPFELASNLCSNLSQERRKKKVQHKNEKMHHVQIPRAQFLKAHASKNNLIFKLHRSHIQYPLRPRTMPERWLERGLGMGSSGRRILELNLISATSVTTSTTSPLPSSKISTSIVLAWRKWWT